MSSAARPLDPGAIALILVLCLTWAFNQSASKLALPEIPPMLQAALRSAAALPVLLLLARIRGVKMFERDGTLRAGLLAGLLFTGEFSCIYLGLRDTTASRLTVFVYTSPFVVALVMPRISRAETLNRIQWLGLLIAFAAVAVAFSEGFLGGHMTLRQLRGDALALAGGVLWGRTTVVIRATKLATLSAEKTLFYQVAVTAVAAPLVSLGLGETWSLHYSAYAWGAIAVQTAIGAFASYLAWMWLLRHYPATQMASFTFLTPVFALVFGVALLHEPLTLQLVLALAGVAAGFVLVNRRPPTRA